MRINLITMGEYCIRTLLPCLAMALGLWAFPALAGGNWAAENRSAWELVPDDQWTADTGLLLQCSPSDTTDYQLANYAAPNDAVTQGDFTLTVRAGFNPGGYPLDENGRPNWRIYHRTLAFGVMADSLNGLLAVFCRTNGERNGIVRIVNGRESWLTRPTGGQGVGLEIHDLREYRMNRKGNLITVWLDSVPVFQAVDTLGPLDGRPVVCGPGAVGIAVESMRLEDSAPEASVLELPAAVDSFIVGMENGAGPILWDIYGKPLGTMELGDSLFGWWTTESPRDGGKSWVAAGGQFTIPNFSLAPEATIEMWFRLRDVPKEGVPLLHFGFDGSRMDGTWLVRERGGPMAMPFPDSLIGLHFHEFGDGNADLPGIFELGKWTHLAWVRQGALHSIFVDKQEVLSLYLPKYGDRELTGLQLNVGQNADHDWILNWGKPYLELNCLRAVPEALEPEKFMPEHFARSKQDENGSHYLFSLSVPYPNPFSPSLAPNINVPAGWSEEVVLDVIDREGYLVRELFTGNLEPGSHTMQWDGLDIAGERLKSGIYYYRLRSGNEIRIGKLILLR